MSTSQRYKKKKKSGGRFVQMHEWLMRSEAWRTLKPGPRALYLEIKRRFNGHNNGEIVLSHRQAAESLNVHRNTIGPWFGALVERGLIVLSIGPHLGCYGEAKASVWRLAEEATPDGRPATKEFMEWRNQNQRPRTK